MTEKERIEKIMLKEEMSSTVFAAEIGIQSSTLSHILNGRNNPSLEVLKKILNRFRTISSDWLILGVGSMYRSEKQSQAPTLFDSLEEISTKSATYTPETDPKTDAPSVAIQQKKAPVHENTPKPAQEPQHEVVMNMKSDSRLVRKIIIYYNDNTFQEFETK